jgi:hypothetical protein
VNDYEVRHDTENRMWTLVENGTVVGAWPTKREAEVSYRLHTTTCRACREHRGQHTCGLRGLQNMMRF